MVFIVSVKFLTISKMYYKKKIPIMYLLFIIICINVYIIFKAMLIIAKNVQFTHKKSNFVFDNDSKIILFWTPMFSSEYHYFNTSDFRNCANNNCLAISDRFLVPSERIDAFVFPGAEYIREIHGVPPLRLPHQVYIFSNMESPENTPFSLSKFDNFFNWTMTYRLDSDIKTPYGRVIKKKTNYTLPTKEQLLSKTSEIAWVVSNCNTASLRSILVLRLKQFINIDVYGKCGNLTCPENCVDSIAKSYKFYLAFENSYCVDYVTEKLFNYLKHDIIPIVYGGADYDSIVPEKSVINVENFKTVRHLAKHLKYLSENSKEYLKYFEWKKHYVVDDISVKSLCSLCEKLNQPFSTKTYASIYTWWYQSGTTFCKKEQDLPRIVWQN